MPTPQSQGRTLAVSLWAWAPDEPATGFAVIANRLAELPANPIWTYDILACAAIHLQPPQLESQRRAPALALRQTALRHADDQTVAGLAAVLAALRTADLKPEQCSSWGVVAAPRFLGRSVLSAALGQFAADGPWSVSPHIVAQQSQHAVAGLVTQMLNSQGPSLGVGGGPGAGAEAALTIAALLQSDPAAGAWLVLTGWNQEPVAQNETPQNLRCSALALALTATQSAGSLPRFCVCPNSMSDGTGDDVAADQAWFSCVEQLERISNDARQQLEFSDESARMGTTAMIWPLSGVAWVEIGSERALQWARPQPGGWAGSQKIAG